MRRHLSLLIGSLVLGLSLLIAPAASWAYPFWAQQNYDSPREATGKIVCANCHLAKKLTQAEVPQSVLPDTVFTASVKIPYEEGLLEIGADGSDVGLQVGAVVMLPDGFTLAPQDRWTEEMKEETEGVYFSQYSDDQPNILLVGPIPGDQHQEVVFPLLSPDPATDSNIHFGKYQLHVGGNRGRGQVYPTGEKSNNAVYTAPASGSVAAIEDGDNGSSILTINTADGAAVTETIPVGPQLLVNVGDNVEAGAALTNDPNVGGFGQVDAEIVLQNPVRIYGLLAFFAAVALAQIMLVLKKRQIEKVQAAEGNF
ncbi:apocytochrome f [Synechococcus sp. WH 8103]|jgi:apocytochrome f|uniref:Cytochrome f n=1 Tax=Parasynechococcus marenigrum (strain WH8102) TaxID=84588 RepID=CYF_PARMW|nr:apocytochrome f [Parasynechococcus marenigrum]Q7U565.1 RecName: Full=Cytochrome f; Flags: Precursor [Parasynechococcus marenigrum WH 8102]QNJ17577.1 apocytochrome f [Synechococcus sp. A18-40]RNC90520.1 MAG: apocytochrome f [Synechococcus sp. YX04-3]CRY92813.1 apocytochrome f [Synechococcus sp. WH 8103]CAE08357.1 apocytochrome f [Parasynechococcus marenigrum WH 8102]|tara:strand:+ start:1427 stop:2362 length:936 start_codon:yes stop_codon:yes gene_type:complete